MKLYYKDEYIRLFQGDCLEVMDKLIEKGIKFDAIITDPPYGTTQCKWDSVIPFDKMWERINRLIKDLGIIVFTSSQPFTSALVMSNTNLFKYELIWEKEQGTGQLNAKKMPLKKHESILIFSKGKLGNITYNPQMEEGKPYSRNDIGKVNNIKEKVYGVSNGYAAKNVTTRYPTSIIQFNMVKQKGQHPTQKPISLMEYLINTYTNENELILDFTCGSGTTLLAARNLKRKCIGIELEEKYCEIAKNRLVEF